MNFFQRNRVFKTINSSDLIPVRICGHEEAEGRVVVLVPKFENRFIHILFPVTAMMFFRVKLDDTGSEVWKNICGEKNIFEISRISKNNHKAEGNTGEENLERLISFMRMLYERRCISFRQLM
jgi:hypothetical protein